MATINVKLRSASEISTLQSLCRAIVFIDGAVTNYSSLATGVLPETDAVVLDLASNGVEQITRVLADYRQLSSLHIVAHGTAGMMQLGTALLCSETLNRYAHHLMRWADALSPDADLLLYGCGVAQGDRGLAFVQRLSELTGAKVAASARLTGCSELGGTWELEVRTGQIKAPLAFLPSTLATYTSVLPWG